MTIKRCIVVSLFALSLPATALADPKKEAIDAMSWGLQYCKDALNPDHSVDDAKQNYDKFKARLDTAVAADPSIRTWTGQLRGMKVNEGIAKCEKEIPERIAKEMGALKTENRDGALVRGCWAAKQMALAGHSDDWADYEKKKAEAIKENKGPLTGDVADQLAKCEAQHAADEEAGKKQNAEFQAARDKHEQEQIAEGKKRVAEEKKLRASLKGDRARIYDAYGKPTNWDGELGTTPEWRWFLDKTRMGYEATCWTYVRFKGNKKVKEWKDGEACKW